MKRRSFIAGLLTLPFIGAVKPLLHGVFGQPDVLIDGFSVRHFYDIDAGGLVSASTWNERHDGVWHQYASYWYVSEVGTVSVKAGRKQLVYRDGTLIEVHDA